MNTTHTAQSKITHHCEECGKQVAEFCADHPRAAVASALNTAAQTRQSRLPACPNDIAWAIITTSDHPSVVAVRIVTVCPAVAK